MMIDSDSDHESESKSVTVIRVGDVMLGPAVQEVKFTELGSTREAGAATVMVTHIAYGSGGGAEDRRSGAAAAARRPRRVGSQSGRGPPALAAAQGLPGGGQRPLARAGAAL